MAVFAFPSTKEEAPMLKCPSVPETALSLTVTLTFEYESPVNVASIYSILAPVREDTVMVLPPLADQYNLISPALFKPGIFVLAPLSATTDHSVAVKPTIAALLPSAMFVVSVPVYAIVTLGYSIEAPKLNAEKLNKANNESKNFFICLVILCSFSFHVGLVA